MLLEETGTIVTKVCRICKIEKSLADYYKSKAGTRDGHQHECKDCHNAQSMKNHWKNRDAKLAKQREYHFLSSYGLTRDEVEQKKLDQDNKCAICGSQTSLVVDHNHETGKVRELLCSQCNQAIGSVYENTDTLKNMISYLEKHN